MDDDALHTRLQEMIDRADIHDCMVRYARGMDRRDRDLLRSAYHDGAIDDHVGFVGLVDDFIDWALPYHSPATSTTYSTTVQISAATRATRRPTTSSWAPTGNRKTISQSTVDATSTGSNVAMADGVSLHGSAWSNGTSNPTPSSRVGRWNFLPGSKQMHAIVPTFPTSARWLSLEHYHPRNERCGSRGVVLDASLAESFGHPDQAGQGDLVVVAQSGNHVAE
jgi:hypothetical protein